MSKRSYEERLDSIQVRLEQLRAQERAIKRQQSADERKKRTHRLIQMGAIVESVLGRATVDDDKERLERFLRNQERRGKFFSKAMNLPEDEVPVSEDGATE